MLRAFVLGRLPTKDLMQGHFDFVDMTCPLCGVGQDSPSHRLTCSAGSLSDELTTFISLCSAHEFVARGWLACRKPTGRLFENIVCYEDGDKVSGENFILKAHVKATFVDGSCLAPAVRWGAHAGYGISQVDSAGQHVREVVGCLPADCPQSASFAEHFSHC